MNFGLKTHIQTTKYFKMFSKKIIVTHKLFGWGNPPLQNNRLLKVLQNRTKLLFSRIILSGFMNMHQKSLFFIMFNMGWCQVGSLKIGLQKSLVYQKQAVDKTILLLLVFFYSFRFNILLVESSTLKTTRFPIYFQKLHYFTSNFVLEIVYL